MTVLTEFHLPGLSAFIHVHSKPTYPGNITLSPPARHLLGRVSQLVTAAPPTFLSATPGGRLSPSHLVEW